MRCLTIPENCTACDVFHQLSSWNLTTNTRTCLCPVGQFENPTPEFCQNCNLTLPNCIKCSNGLVCELCYESFILNSVTGHCECPPRTNARPYTVTWVVSGVTHSVVKQICVSALFIEKCNVDIGPTVTEGLVSYSYSCQCPSAGDFIRGACA